MPRATRTGPQVMSSSSSDVEALRAEEQTAVDALLEVITKCKRFGVDKDDQQWWSDIGKHCAKLEQLYPLLPQEDASPAAGQAVQGDWQVIATTSPVLADNQGVTGYGKLPFTQLYKFGLFFRYGPAAVPSDEEAQENPMADPANPVPMGYSELVEVLAVFGRPSIKNELRGQFRWESDYRLSQTYTVGDISGQANQQLLSKSEVEWIWMAENGDLRVARSVDGSDGHWYVFKRLYELGDFFAALNLPVEGGTSMNNMGG